MCGVVCGMYAVWYVCTVCVVHMYDTVSMYGMHMSTLYVRCSVWCDVCGVVGFLFLFFNVHIAFPMRPY